MARGHGYHCTSYRPASMGGAVIHATTSHHERKRGSVGEMASRMGRRGGVGWGGTAAEELLKLGFIYRHGRFS